jgi:hypothetical protein
VEKMKKHYDFSKGEKGKFYIPEEEIELPVYLNTNNQKYYLDLATNKKIAMSKLINSILTKDKDIVDLILSD